MVDEKGVEEGAEVLRDLEEVEDLELWLMWSRVVGCRFFNLALKGVSGYLAVRCFFPQRIVS